MQVVGHESEVLRNSLQLRFLKFVISAQNLLHRAGKIAGQKLPKCMGPIGRIRLPGPIRSDSSTQLIAWRAGSNRSVAIMTARSICDSSMLTAASFAGVSSQ
jgi:hypothetical protein